MSSVEALSKAILGELLADFSSKNLQANDLHNSYDGAELAAIKERFRTAGPVSDVDFDLALRGLEKGDLIRTGPMVPFENDPNSSVLVLMFFSQYRNASLTEKGYKAAQKAQVKRNPTGPTQRVHISGSNFHNTQIGIGTEVTQSFTTTLSEAPVFVDLRRAIEVIGDADDRGRIIDGIDAMRSARTKTELG